MRDINIDAVEVEEAIFKLEEVQGNITFIISALESMIDTIADNKLFKIEEDVNEKLENIVDNIQTDYEDSIEVLTENLNKVLEFLEGQDKANKKGIV